MIVHPATMKVTSRSQDSLVYDGQAPPSYAAAMDGASGHAPYDPDAKTLLPSDDAPCYQAGPSQIPGMRIPTVYNYVNPQTGEVLASLLPPTHPQMMCLQDGGHEPKSHYGILGVLAAIFWFPLGVGLCLMDRRVYCKRCGVAIDEGLC